MQFIEETPSPNDWMLYPYVSENGEWRIYILRVLFGYRVRVNQVGKCFDLVDYCCRDSTSLLIATHIVCKTRLEALDELSEPAIVKALPSGKDKLFCDPELLKHLGLEAFIEVATQ